MTFRKIFKVINLIHIYKAYCIETFFYFTKIAYFASKKKLKVLLYFEILN